ncbi:MAG: RnfABCDGE type electron transport complex subunit G [bacterium]|jgi:electron transport complex protein RnfG|nr:RnfABCDGE type electron transport complex subunit G [bacterium]MDD3804662.1 RnfABCDGE type electron transport complex subunit G [bacterium]MDD4153776.1 RnfABCDGE type electron transport complex subunit G [bacterium]MDD4557469.1 RnfABCDGE type electron transport complex subunit G [bacterium]
MKEVIKLGLALLVICAIAGLALGLTYNITLPRIKAQEEAARQRLYRNLLPGADIFKEITIGTHKYQMGLLHGQRIGVVSTVTGKGYGGDIVIVVGIDQVGRVTGVSILSQNETPGLGSKAAQLPFLRQYAGKGAEELKLRVDGGKIDAVTAATITSRAVTSGVKGAVDQYLHDKERLK